MPIISIIDTITLYSHYVDDVQANTDAIAY